MDLLAFVSYTSELNRIFNPLKPSGVYMYHLLYESVTLHFVFVGLV
jgi:hypothetical protein